MIPLQPLPTQLTFYVNYPCNLRCKHCFLFGVADYDREYMAVGTTQEMSWEVLEAAMRDHMDAPGPLSVCFMGGEPLLHRGIAKFASHIKSRPDTYLDINTNGTMPVRWMQELVDAGIDAVYISLDGSSPEVNDPNRGKGAFDKAMRGLRFLLAYRNEVRPSLRVAVNYSITALNYLDLADMARLSGELGLDELFLNLPSFVRQHEGEAAARELAGEGYRFESWRGLVIDEMVDSVRPSDFVAEVERLQSQTRDFDLYLQPVNYDAAELGAWFGDGWSDVMRETGCPIQSFRTTVLPNGDVTPCTIYPDLVVGNVLDASLGEVWNGDKYHHFRSLVTNRLLPTCNRCCDLYDEANGDPNAFVNDTRRAHLMEAAANAG